MPPKAAVSIFHPKKKAAKPTNVPSPSRNTSLPPKPKPPAPKTEEEDNGITLPPIGSEFQEYRLLSTATHGWKYDVMKFDSRKPVDVMDWQAPVKLNRKDLRRDDPNAHAPPQAVRPMLGLDGNQVIGADGKPVMVDAEGRVVVENAGASGSDANGGKGKGAANAKKKFQKKTRQVFVVPEEVRQLRKEERYPWVFEDATGSENWVAQLEDTSKAETHAFFVPAQNYVFKFVPAHRWYKFQKKLKHDLPTDTQTMESAYVKSQKRDPQLWLTQRNGTGPSSATAAMFKAEAEGRALSGSSSLVHNAGESLGPGGRRLKTVDSGRDLFGEDDDDGDAKRRRDKEYGGEGDLDEAEYEEDFADDDEKMDVDNDDEETKELEERLKKEYKTANKQRDGHIDESDEEDTPGKTKQEKAMQKLIRNREGNNAYDSDEEKNPYASSEEEEEEEELVVPPPPPENVATPTPPADTSKDRPQTPKPGGSRPQEASAGSGSRATSPVASPVLGGHSVVAKRATSPKAPKLKTNVSRGNSPLASRPGSPVGPSRATSPVAGGMGSRAGSPVAGNQTVANGAQKKRKATEDGPTSPTTANGISGAPPKAKKRKAAAYVPTGELEDAMVIEWLKNHPEARTRECIAHFTPYLTDDVKKAKFTALVKEVAQLKGGLLILRPAYRGSGASAAPSPAATPAA